MPRESRPAVPEVVTQQKSTATRQPASAAPRKVLADAASSTPRSHSSTGRITLPPTEQSRNAPPATTTQRLRAEPYIASHRLPQEQMRRFASPGSAGPADWFHVAAHKIDLVVRPSLAGLVFLLNILMQSAWALIQIGASLLPDDARRQIRQTRAPMLQADHPFAAIVFFVALIWLVGGIARPIVWENSDPREFSLAHRAWTPNPSDPLKAVDLLRSVWNVVVPAPAPVSPVQVAEPIRPAGDHNVQGAPSVTPAQIDQILQSYNSPAVGTGQVWYDLGKKYDIDPAYAVAFFIHESSAGTNPGWAGLKDDGSTTHNIGNIICAGYSTCYGRFRDYPTWDAGIDDWYRLISVEYIQGRGTVTVDQIVPVYAPSFENNVEAYVSAVTSMVDDWRTNGVR